MGAFGAFASPFQQLRPIQAPSPFEYAAQFGQLQALAQNRELRQQEMQLRQQEQQQNAIKLQQQQQSQRDQQLLTKAYMDSGGDLEKFKTNAANSGASITGINTVAEGLLKHAQEVSAYNKDELANYDARNAAIRNASETLLGIQDPVQRAATYQQMKPGLQKVGVTDLPDQLPEGEAGNTWLGIHRNWANSAKQISEQEQAKRAAEEATLKLAGEKRGQAITDLRMLPTDPANGLPTPQSWAGWLKAHPEIKDAPPQPTKAYISQMVESTIGAKDLPTYETAVAEREATQALRQNPERLNTMVGGSVPPAKYPDEFRATVNQARIALDMGLGVKGVYEAIKAGKDRISARENAAAGRETGPAAEVARRTLENMPTAADAEYAAKKLIDHEMSPSEFNQIKLGRGAGGFGLKVLQAAERLQPGFDIEQAETDYKTKAKTEADFTTGKEATLVRSNNNALEHLALLDQARQVLANNDIPLLNKIANSIGVQFGSDKATTFDHIAQRVGDEVSKAFLPGGGGQAEREKAHRAYSYNLGDQQIASNIKADVHLLDSQQRNLQDQYQRGTYGKGQQKLYTDRAMAARSQILGTGGKVGPKAGDTRQHMGSTYKFDGTQWVKQ